ncbi:DNA-processing protein DprA [Acetobacter oeni]|uniref:DNA processing protein DprA n=1 Tax=Acetobacter oeni TaxID=304077 RepID=A0A511XGS3_9PROT|nr:DNA-processing protein DprA [Acetobacter oeni]MBB3881728.1 DNA processing protein [Acetobacter oeni]NHO17468.1 DNA-protecting protein DprA [Acetobacter oeni]GBR01860.1 DNA processing protein DprA [Acetobacter oeni LMG 21952]GEN62101.1 DNA processing protein DprA [Acetobacter oeni]
MNPDLPALLRLARTENVGPVTWRRLMVEYGTAEQALAALPERARRGGRRGPLQIASEASVAKEIEGVLALGGRIITLHDPEYPPLLAELPDSPPVLTVLGNPACLTARSVGIVGARNASAAGMRFTESLATELSREGITVVSGLARGIDGAAHRGALHGAFPDRGGTVAAIAGGIDVVYPQENTALQARIAAEGALITEAPLGTVPQARHFPRRNRLIAGLSLGTVVVEAAVQSGSLITARLADDYSRAVFAVPGSPLDPRCRGSNDLLRSKNAHLVENIADILPWLRHESPGNNWLFSGFSERQAPWGERGTQTLSGLDTVRDRVLSLLSYTPVTVDDLVRHCQFSVSAVLSVLTELELAGRVESLPGGAVVLLVPPETE